MSNFYNFTIIDGLVLSSAILLSVATGIYFAITDRKKNNTEEYFHGRSKMPALPVGISLAVSFISGISMMSYPVEAYYYGAVWLWVVPAFPLAVMVSCIYFIPLYYKLKLPSLYEYMELRFDKSVRLICSALTILYCFNYMAVMVYVPGLALSTLTPITVHWSIVLIASVCTFYTVIGGFKSVIWTDTMQSVLMISGAIAILARAISLSGGYEEVMEALSRGNRSDWWILDFSPTRRYSSLSLTLGYFTAWLVSFASNQTEVQRYLSCRSERQAKVALLVAVIPQILITTASICTGLVAYAYFEGCDPLSTQDIDSNGQLIPFLVGKIANGLHGFVGLFVVAIYCGTMSSFSSSINSVCLIIMEDFVKLKWPDLTEKRKLSASKMCGLLIGVLATMLSLALTKIDSTIARLNSTLNSLTGLPILGIVILGVHLGIHTLD